MVDYHKILRYDSLAYSKKQISLMVHSSHHAVEDTLNAVQMKVIRPGHWMMTSFIIQSAVSIPIESDSILLELLRLRHRLHVDTNIARF